MARRRTLGQSLLASQRRSGSADQEVLMMFINQLSLDAIPAEVESLPCDFRKILFEYLKSMAIGSPGWDDCFLIHGIYYFPNRTPEEVEAIYAGIAKKNRVTAEALWQYFQTDNAVKCSFENCRFPS